VGTSVIARPAAETAAQRGLVYWETGAVGEVAAQAEPGVRFFRVAPSGAVLGREAVDFVRDQLAPRLRRAGPLRYTVVYVDDAFGAVHRKHASVYDLPALLPHAAGDLVLKTFAERLQRAIRGSDVAIRLGGDEFMALLPECRVDEVRHVLARIEGVVCEYEGTRIPCGFSRGWTDYKPGESPQELLKRADEALYLNKRAGKKTSGEITPAAVSQSTS
jgi:GGDEF domain-containing protein